MQKIIIILIISSLGGLGLGVGARYLVEQNKPEPIRDSQTSIQDDDLIVATSTDSGQVLEPAPAPPKKIEPPQSEPQPTPGASSNFEEHIKFAITEQTDRNKLDGPHLYLSVATEKIYNCANYQIRNDIVIDGNVVRVILKDVVRPNICLTSLGSANFRQELNLAEGEYTIEFYSKLGVDRYKIVISETNISIEQISASFSEATATKADRVLSGQIFVICFRYHYGCENKDDIIDELCPILFDEVEKVATPVPKGTKNTLGGYCHDKDIEEGKCRLYDYSGDIKDLEQIFEVSKTYNLAHGYKAECADQPSLYYRGFNTWLGHSVVMPPSY